jgi:anti-sigma-K factor RskA
MLAELALDALSAEERERVLAHVSGCAECQRELTSLREAVGALAYAAPVAPLDATRCVPMRERLVARAAAERGSSGEPAPGEADPRPLRPTQRSAAARPARAPGWMALAASLLVAAALGWYALSQRDEAARLSGELATAVDQRRLLESQVDSLRNAVGSVLGPAVRVVDLTSAGERRPGGRMFWDQATDTWTFVAHDLPSLRAGRTYQLWLIDAAQQRISAGTFAPQPNGRAFVKATYRLPPDSLAMVAVTEEPEGGVPQPTGEIVLAGAASR